MNLDQAIEMALQAHAGQVDKGGQPYILHCLRVMLKMGTEQEMVLAVLHDVLEDAPGQVVHGLDIDAGAVLNALCHEPREEYADYICRIVKVANSGAPMSKIAAKIKIADLEDNLNTLRIARSLLPGDLTRIQKYHLAWRILKTEVSL